jgi:DNA-binding transcriptional MerR regulator
VRSNASPTRPLHSAELARRTGVSTDTLRFYERRGLLAPAPRSLSGYRLYPAEAAGRVRMIRGALSIGFSVNELAAIFRERDGGGAPCHQVRKLAGEKLTALEERLRDLRSWRRVLRKTLTGWDRALRETPRGKRAGLLEAFVATHPTRQKRRAGFDALARGKRKREKQQ